MQRAFRRNLSDPHDPCPRGRARGIGPADTPGPDGKDGFSLWAPAPNPARAETMIGHELPGPGAVRLLVQDVSGRTVQTIENRRLGAGVHWAEWNGRDQEGPWVVSGVSWVRIQAAFFSASRRVVCLL